MATVDSQMQVEEAERLRQQGVPEELIRQLLDLGQLDPAALTKQYEAAAFLRRGATDPNFAKSKWHIPAQALMGGMVGYKDKQFADALRKYQTAQTSARDAWYRTKYPRPASTSPQVTPKPEEEVYPD